MFQFRPKIHIAAACALLAMTITASTANAAVSTSKPPAKHHPKRASLAGTWKGTYSGAFAGTFTLHWTQKGPRLTGTITLSNPNGTFSISGSVHGTAIQFGAVGAGASYTGKVSGKSMSGSYLSPKGGGTWGAHKTS